MWWLSAFLKPFSKQEWVAGMIDVGTTFFSLMPEMDPSMMLKEEVFDG